MQIVHGGIFVEPFQNHHDFFSHFLGFLIRFYRIHVDGGFRVVFGVNLPFQGINRFMDNGKLLICGYFYVEGDEDFGHERREFLDVA